MIREPSGQRIMCESVWAVGDLAGKADASSTRGSRWQLRGKKLSRSCVGFQIVGISDAMPVGLKMRRPSHPLSCGIDFVLCVYP